MEISRDKEIRNAIDTIIPISPLRDGRTYEQAMMATGFEAGVKWADAHPKSPWISVEDDLPYNHEELLIGDTLTKGIIIRNPDGSVSFSLMYLNVEWKWIAKDKPTHWFPIPELPKE